MKTNRYSITVLGLGKMGVTLVRLMLEKGHRVTVWNRSAAKAADLVAAGATLAATPAEAVAAGDLILICVHDYQASAEILGARGVAAAIKGRLLIQLTTGSPEDARRGGSWAAENGAAYLDGAIQAAPTQMGQADTLILVSGAKHAWERGQDALVYLAGGTTYLGEKISAAAAMDLATLSYVYGATLGFFHGALIGEAEGFGAEEYGAIVAKIAPAFGEFLKYEGGVIQKGDFRVSESPMSISVEATERILNTARDSGINTEIPQFFAGFFQRAAAAGYADEEVASIIKLLRKPAGA
ncbi:NAD(P)-binding domain-containing protein [Luteolibacter sp. GHJ8]|uniref:NAD(P)-binding domain-containing protein n=1 Tax=Luteolibacter rhizosphaerae TaxID=2989719 RepID=A0ABT3G5E5_9BACT|nr:NAD(P)-binding domain-containing protein [Luteolibacter rhizosphaerae]MCW1915079.1 NAD(P)-binding domain-containing protein [Luteolibacter rhizosphaerae]